MDPIWLGPYIIKRSIGKGLYELKNDAREIIMKKANISRLKLYTPRDPVKRVLPDDDKPRVAKKPCW